MISCETKNGSSYEKRSRFVISHMRISDLTAAPSSSAGEQVEERRAVSFSDAVHDPGDPEHEQRHQQEYQKCSCGASRQECGSAFVDKAHRCEVNGVDQEGLIHNGPRRRQFPDTEQKSPQGSRGHETAQDQRQVVS